MHAWTHQAQLRHYTHSNTQPFLRLHDRYGVMLKRPILNYLEFIVTFSGLHPEQLLPDRSLKDYTLFRYLGISAGRQASTRLHLSGSCWIAALPLPC